MNTNNTKRCYQCMHFKQDSKYPTGDCDFTDFKEGFNLHAEDKACNRFEETDMRKVREAFENKFLEFEKEKTIAEN